ncbi:dual oxidase maturation factor 1-like [Onthophagus taurus]|uniref:dual oxidase maturation factor 1-like n=1 Tax=Onthophagus taurus TaxID=166361 RepID=UPI000C20D1F8|nr:dual oxidase maturation factor 1-like [Onthophagus taurus]
MAFDLGRKEGFPTQYAPNQTPVTVDVLEVGVIVAFVILYVALLLFIPGKKISTSFSRFTRITVSLLIGLLIILGNIGQEWEVAHIRSKTAYKAGSGEEITADIGVKIGLRSVNVTLKSGSILKQQEEMIDYNERFSWVWDQGRFGFGPYAGRIQREFRAAQFTGLPLPILWVVDYFVIDGEGFRYGRFYRTAGWYAHIAIWTAFPCWIIANILFKAVVQYGAIFLGLAGGFLLLGNFLWAVIRNPLPLVIPFEDDILKFSYGSSFWITLITGLACIFIAVAIYILDIYFNEELYMFFGLDNLLGYEETYGGDDTEEMVTLRHDTLLPLKVINSHKEEEENIYDNPKPRYVKRSIYRRKSQKSKKVDSHLMEDIYQNV